MGLNRNISIMRALRPVRSTLARTRSPATPRDYRSVVWQSYHLSETQRDTRQLIKLASQVYFSVKTGELCPNQPFRAGASDEVPQQAERRRSIEHSEIDANIDPITNRRRVCTGAFLSIRDEYTDLSSYVESRVGDAPQNTLSNSTPKYDCLHLYESAKQDFGSSIDQNSMKYGDLGKYGPVEWQEPNGLRSLTPEEESKDYDDLHNYGAIKWNEPNGVRDLTAEEVSKDYDDLHKYGPVKWNEPDGLRPLTAEEKSKDYDDLHKYGPMLWNEPDGVAVPTAEEKSRNYRDLNKYSLFLHNEPDGQASAQSPDDPMEGEPSKCQAFQHNEPDGKKEEFSSLGNGLEEFDNKHDILEYGMPVSTTILRGGLQEFSAENFVQEETLETARHKLRPIDIRPRLSTVHENPIETLSDKMAKLTLESSKPLPSINLNELETEPISLAEDEPEISSMDGYFPNLEPPKPVHQQRLLSKYTTYKHTPDLSFYSTPLGLELSYLEECRGFPTWPTYVRSYGTLVSPPKCDLAGPAMASPKPVNTCTSQNRSSKASGISGQAASPEQALYKVLAYDPAMQTIVEADTTSTVPDGAKPMTTPEVLLRISNPALFSPYFQVMEMKGYEIVSGGGNVLVFRKVRDGQRTTTEHDKSFNFPKSRTASLVESGPRINPIDMMGSRPYIPSIGNFASPTGFVNYDDPVMSGEESQPKPPPPSRLAAAVLKDGETLPPGIKSHGGRRKGLVRRVLFSVACVTGGSFAAGVVGEYFRTGGSDGHGPKGF
jgi:hypothetical protein